jgi:adenylate cyclase
VLNFTFQRQADIVSKHQGDIDKFVGDQIVAVFLGEDMVLNATLCALEIQDAMAALALEHPDWGLAVGIGVNAGQVIMGAMGSSSRMDYTVLGDAVNLAARLCSHAARGQILLSADTYRTIAERAELAAEPLAPIAVKGKSEPVRVYAIHPASAAHAPVAEARTA